MGRSNAAPGFPTDARSTCCRPTTLPPGSCWHRCRSRRSPTKSRRSRRCWTGSPPNWGPWTRSCLSRTHSTRRPTTPSGLGFPHAEQAVRITRTRTIKGKTTREAAYMVVSLPAEHAQPTDLGTWARSEWHIENRVHYVRDVTLREDAHQAQTGNGPAVFATLRNTSIGYHRSNGETNIARATRRANHRPHDLIDAVTRSNPTTQ